MPQLSWKIELFIFPKAKCFFIKKNPSVTVLILPNSLYIKCFLESIVQYRVGRNQRAGLPVGEWGSHDPVLQIMRDYSSRESNT